MQSLLLGGVAVATPPDAGDPVNHASRFVLHEKMLDEWREWNPLLPMRNKVGNAARTLPETVEVIKTWEERNLFGQKKPVTKFGRMTPIGQRLMGPASLVYLPEGVASNDVTLTVNGRIMIGRLQPAPEGDLSPVGWLDIAATGEVWSNERYRVPTAIEDVLVLVDRNQPAKLISTELMRADQGLWAVDDNVVFASSWHGASVVSEADQKVIGFLSLKSGEGHVVPLAEAATVEP